MFNFWGNCQIISKVVVPFYTPISIYRRVPPIFNIMSLFNFRHFNNFIVISHCGFNLNFSNDQKCWASVHMLIFHTCVFCSEVSNFLPTFLFEHFFSYSSVLRILIYSDYKSFSRSIICIYLPAVCSLLYHPLNSVFQGV